MATQRIIRPDPMSWIRLHIEEKESFLKALYIAQHYPFSIKVEHKRVYAEAEVVGSLLRVEVKDKEAFGIDLPLSSFSLEEKRGKILERRQQVLDAAGIK